MGRIERFLAHEAGEPFYEYRFTWVEGRNNRDSTRPEERERERDNLALALRRFQTRASLRLADRLSRCRTGKRCVSGACPVCQSAAQRLLVHAARDVFDQWRPISMVTAVSKRAVIPADRLGDSSLFGRIAAQVSGACGAIGARAFGGFDVSLNVHEREHYAAHYVPHAHIFCESWAYNEARSIFSEFFPPQLHDFPVKRPLKAKPFDGQRRGYAYAIKPDMFKRVTLAPRPRFSSFKGNTRSKPLPERERCRLALELDREGLDARFFFVGCKLRLSRDLARIRIVRTRMNDPNDAAGRLDRLRPNTLARSAF